MTSLPVTTTEAIVKARIMDPNRTMKSIAEEFKVSDEAVRRIVKGMSSLPELRTNRLLIAINSIVEDVTELTANKITELKDKELSIADVKQLNEIAEINRKRKQLMTGWATENVWIVNLASLYNQTIDATNDTSKPIENDSASE